MPRFCVNCGKQLNERANFCTACGSRVCLPEFISAGNNEYQYYSCSAQTESSESSKSSANNAVLINQMNRALAYFNIKAVEYYRIRVLEQEIINEQSAFQSGKSLSKGIVYLLLGFIFMLFGQWVALLGVITAIVGLFCIVIRLIERLTADSRKEKLNQKINHLAKLRQALMLYYNAYQNCPVSFEYSDPTLIQSLTHIISTGRADSVKEAINCFLHDRQMGELKNQQKEEAEKSRRHSIP